MKTKSFPEGVIDEKNTRDMKGLGNYGIPNHNHSNHGGFRSFVGDFFKPSRSYERAVWDRFDNTVLEVFFRNKDRYMEMGELRGRVLKEGDKINLRMLAMNYGMKGRIARAIGRWRRQDYPILSSDTYGKGYILLTPENTRLIEIWEDKFRANRKRREIPKEERKRDERIYWKLFEQCEVPQKKKQMIKLAVRMKIRKKKVI